MFHLMRVQREIAVSYWEEGNLKQVITRSVSLGLRFHE